MMVLISGSPASGKDAVTERLEALPKFVRFRKHKSSEGGRLDPTYHLVSRADFDAMAAGGEFVQHHVRYGRGYGVSRDELVRHFDRGDVPIIHVGRYENLHPFLESGLPKVSVLLLVSRNETLRRLEARHPQNGAEVSARIAAYDEETALLRDICAATEHVAFDLVLRNAGVHEAAAAIERVVHTLECADQLSVRQAIQDFLSAEPAP